MSYTKSSTRRESYPLWSSNMFAGPPVNWVLSSTPVSYAKTKTGEYLPHWKNLIRQGKDATTPFDGTIQEGTAEPGHMKVSFWYPLGQPRQNQQVKWAEVRGFLLPPSAYGTSTGADVTSANSAALVLLAKKIESVNTHMMGGVFLGEIREVVKLITSPAKTLREGLSGYFSTLAKRKSRAPKHRLKKILADTWLEYSFGWKPLISDSIAAAETLARWNLEKEGIMFRRSSARGYAGTQALMSAVPTTFNLVNNYCYYKTVSRDMAEAKVIWRCGLEYKATAPVGSAARLANLAGFNNNLESWIPTAWELIPWSFVVDYFSNVGDILSFCCTDKSNMTWKNKTVVQTGMRETSAMADVKGVTTAISNKDLISIEGSSLGTSVSKRTVTKRTLPPVLDYPKLEFQYPAFGSTKWINLAALTVSARKLTPYR